MARGNIDNLIKNEDLTPEERQRNARKAGIASGEARRRRKTLKEELLALLEQGDIQERISLAMLKEAEKGNTKAYEVIRDTVGEKPVDKVEADVGITTINISLDEEEE